MSGKTDVMVLGEAELKQLRRELAALQDKFDQLGKRPKTGIRSICGELRVPLGDALTDLDGWMNWDEDDYTPLAVGEYVVPNAYVDDLHPTLIWTPCKVTRIFKNGNLRCVADDGSVRHQGPADTFIRYRKPTKEVTP